MHKIKFTCDWCDDLSLSLRFKKCYISKLYTQNFEITTGEDYTILVSINKPIYHNKRKECKYIGVLMEPSWYLGEHKKSEIYRTCDYVISYTQNSIFTNNIYYPGILPFHVTYEHGPGLDYYIDNTFTKKNLCSIIVSRDKTSHSDDILYNARIKLAEEILKTNLPINIYGKGWNALKDRDSRIKGSLEIEEKYKGLEDYKFSICIENCSEDGYFTEKITDSILTNTIPVYYGCKYIKDFFKSPITLKTLEPTKAIDQISKLLEDENNNQFYVDDKILIATKFNLFVALTKFIDYYYNK